MNEHRTRYGDLTRQAALHLAAAAALVTGEPFHSLPAASAALTAYRDLHDAFYRLGWQLRGGAITAVLTSAPECRDVREAATLDLLEQVGRVATRSYADRFPRQGVAGQLHRAAVQLRAADDLLATHHTSMGRPRTPDAPDLDDPAVAGPAWRDYTALVLAAASIAEPLAVRARAQGVSIERVRGLPWAGERLTRAAERVRVATSVDEPEPGLVELEVANPSVRTGDPLLELSDRLQRMHTAAWTHTQHETMTVPTLTDLAAVGVMLHAAAHRSLNDSAGNHPTTELIAAHGTAWRQVHAALTGLRSITPVPGGIRRDAIAVRRLLPQIESGTRGGRADAVLLDSCRSHDRVAEWSSTALGDLATRGRLYVPGRILTSEDIGEQARLAGAKLTDTLAPAPRPVVDRILASLAAAARTGDEASLAEANPPQARRDLGSVVA